MTVYDGGVVGSCFAHLVDEPAHHLLLSTVLRQAVLHLSVLFISTNHVSVRRAPERMRILCDGDEQGRPLLRKSLPETLPQKEESMLISQDVMHALVSLCSASLSPLIPSHWRRGCPLWDASHARFGTPLCAAHCGWVGCVSVMLCVLLVMDMSLKLTSGLGMRFHPPSSSSASWSRAARHSNNNVGLPYQGSPYQAHPNPQGIYLPPYPCRLAFKANHLPQS